MTKEFLYVLSQDLSLSIFDKYYHDTIDSEYIGTKSTNNAKSSDKVKMIELLPWTSSVLGNADNDDGDNEIDIDIEDSSESKDTDALVPQRENVRQSTEIAELGGLGLG